MTYRERIETIRGFGYTEREALFLELVAVHSGYFLRRQYNQFLGQKRGGTAAALIEKLLAREQVQVESSCSRTPIYHLRRHSLYELIGEPNNRHRRRRGTVGIASKVMALDAILQMGEVAWLGTEAEKRAFFELKLSIPSPFLPCRKAGRYQKSFRYFVDKTPIGYQEADRSSPLEVSFVYVDPGSSTVGFETFLKRNRLLFACLQHLRVVYASPAAARFGAARRVFEDFERNLSGRRREIIEAKIQRVARLLNLVHRLPRDERGAILESGIAERNLLMAEIDPEDLVWLMQLSGRQSESNMRELLRPKLSYGHCEARYKTLHLDHDCRLFGVLA